MVNIGIDFGSTYTIVAEYDDYHAHPIIQFFDLAGTKSVPTVLAVKNGGDVLIGPNAKKASKAKQYRGFKMMLTETSGKNLIARGFDEENTPCAVTESYLKKVLKIVMKNLNTRYIDHLVIGTPLIWNESMSTIDGRVKLRDICKKFPFFRPNAEDEAIQIVSEPEAASAFFAYNYEQDTGKLFNGRILLVDYGGGTLDITLNKVISSIDSNGQKSVEISADFRTGAGENEEFGKMGQAGLVYMETLAERAIHEALPDCDIQRDSAFFSTVDDIEREILNGGDILKDTFDLFGTDPRNLNDDTFDGEGESPVFTSKVYYGSTMLSLTYKMMAEVYDDVIRRVLDGKLDEVIRYMDERKIVWDGRGEENFKIVPVGGFCGFCLVRQQLESKFKFSTKDNRLKNVIHSQEDSECAIALGASLVAAKAVRIKNTVPFSLGAAIKKENYYNVSYGLKCNSDIVFNREYLQTDFSGEPIKLIAVNGIEQFFINFSEDDSEVKLFSLKPEYRSKIQHEMSREKPMVVGFSMDSTETIFLHIQEYDPFQRTCTGNERKIELSNLKNLFEPIESDEAESVILAESVKMIRLSLEARSKGGTQ